MFATKRTDTVAALTLVTVMMAVGAAPALAAPKGKKAPDVEPAVQIEKDGEAAVKAGRYAKAVTLFRGLVALRQNEGDTIFRLAEVYTLAGQYEEAIAELERFVKLSTNADKVAKAKSEIDRLASAPAPFFEAVFRPEPAKTEAIKLFKLGQDFVKNKKFALAVAHYEAAMLLDPDLPGPYRASGAAYAKIGDKKKQAIFFGEYLRLRPDGKTADEIRKMLVKEKVLGKLSIEASYACDVYINGRFMGKQTPLKDVGLPAGRYSITLVNQPYHLVRNMRVKVEATQSQKSRFEFGVISVKLDPWARVKVDGRDMGLWDELGIPAGQYNLSLTAHNGAKSKELSVKVESGKTVVVDKW